MAGSSYGTLFRLSTFGESHGKAIGCIIDGCPAGLSLTEDLVQPFLDRRKPGKNTFTTRRREEDQVEILSGTFEEKTTGTPIAMLIRNTDQHSHDYEELRDCYRPGHADYSFDAKYGFRDYRGGGRSSGRETAARVMGGAVASLLLEQLGIRILTYTSAIGDYEAASLRDRPSSSLSSLKEKILQDPLYMPDQEVSHRAQQWLKTCMEKGDSAGGSIECILHGLPAGIGEGVFHKLDAELSFALMSIGAVKAVEIGDGVLAAKATGAENNDPFLPNGRGGLTKATNHAGGTLGGMSDGSPLILKAYMKPTPSISLPQQSVNKKGEPVQLKIKGRHDPVIVPRAVVVVESMVAITLVDLLLQNLGSRMETLRKFYL